MHARDGALNELRQARDELEKRLLLPLARKAAAQIEDGAAGLGNIIGVGLGEKIVAGTPSGRIAIKVYVAEKRPRGAIAAEALVPRRIGGLRTDVEATGEVRAHHFMRRYRPAPCGVSIGRETQGGSLGCLVERAGNRYLLGNNHVMALVNRGPRGAGIPQPAEIDGASSADAIGTLARFVRIRFGRGNHVDAALARVDPGLSDRRVIRARGPWQRLRPPEVAPSLGLLVQKSGRVTGCTRGRIDAVAVTVDVDFAPLGGTARFVNQFRVRGLRRPFSEPGDSGALVTTWPGNRPVGLLFSGCAAVRLGFCNDIRRVTRALGVVIVY